MRAPGWLGLGMALAIPFSATAQQLGLRPSLQRYSFSDPAGVALSGVELLWIPFAARVPVSGWLTGHVAGGLARGSLEGPEGVGSRAQGLAATRVGFEARLAGEFLVLRAGAVVPGSGAFETLAGARLMGVLASDLLPFDAQPWGGGGAWSGGFESTVERTALTLRLEAGFGARGGRAFEGSGGLVYRPGSEAHVRLEGDFRVGRVGTLSVLAGLQRFGSDAVDDRTVFRSGVRTEALVALAFPLGLVGAGQVYGAVRHRQEGSGQSTFDWLPGVENAPARDLVVAGLDARLAGSGFALLPEAELRVLKRGIGPCFLSDAAEGIRESVCPGGRGWMLSTGLALEVPLADTRQGLVVQAVPFGRLHIGEVRDWNEGRLFDGNSFSEAVRNSSSVWGWQVGLELRTHR